MIFNIGDKVKYDSGEWWFYGTISAVIENSINPCYRLNVERIEKKNCNFSITQSELQLTLESDVVNEPIVEPIVIEQESENQQIRTISGVWERNLDLYQKGERSNRIYTWIAQNRRLFKSNKLSKEKKERLMSIHFPFKTVKKGEIIR